MSKNRFHIMMACFVMLSCNRCFGMAVATQAVFEVCKSAAPVVGKGVVHVFKVTLPIWPAIITGFYNWVSRRLLRRQIQEVKADTEILKQDTKDLKQDTCELRQRTICIENNTQLLQKDTQDIKRDTCELKTGVSDLKEDTMRIRQGVKELQSELQEVKEQGWWIQRDIDDGIVETAEQFQRLEQNLKDLDRRQKDFFKGQLRIHAENNKKESLGIKGAVHENGETIRKLHEKIATMYTAVKNIEKRLDQC